MKTVMRISLAGLAALVVLGVVIWQFGPRFGLYLVPPSPQAYAEQALDRMEKGYFAEGPRWERARAKAIEETQDAGTYEDTYPALERALSVAGGRHSAFFESGRSLAQSAPERDLPQVTTKGSVTTIKVPALTSDDEKFIARYQDAIVAGLDKAPDSCGYVVDLRGNTGGNVWPMAAALSRFLPDGGAGGFVDRQGTRTPVTVEGGRVLLDGREMASAPGATKSKGPVAILQDEQTASSAEALVTMLRPREGVRSFGTKTVGVASANETVQLYDGASMLLTTQMDVDRGGKTHTGAIPPDVPSSTEAAPGAAQRWMSGRCPGADVAT